MAYEPKNFDHLLGTPGFSDQLLKNHFTLYQGYVKNVNTLVQELETLTKEGKAGTPAHSEMQRRLGWEFNGMRLHELYFANMTKSAAKPSESSSLYQLIQKVYGSYEAWEKDFRAIGSMRGIGWAVTYYDPESKELFNVWINEHDVGHFTGCTPLVIMDVFEHAFMLDYGTKRADYIEAFMRAVDWGVVEDRLK